MSNQRQTESQRAQAPQRSERLFTEQDLWYFRTREGREVGPFRYKSEAQSNLDQFLAELENRVKSKR
ncbi:MAG: DUF6316 family protein [Pseudomonadales bacterium]